MQLAAASTELDEIMTKTLVAEISRLELLGPLEIIQILSKNPRATLGLLKEFVVQKIVNERKEIEEVCEHFICVAPH